MLDHVLYIDRFAAEMHRVLRRNGTLTDKYEKAIEDAYHNAMRLNQHDAIPPPRHARV